MELQLKPDLSFSAADSYIKTVVQNLKKKGYCFIKECAFLENVNVKRNSWCKIFLEKFRSNVSKKLCFPMRNALQLKNPKTPKIIEFMQQCRLKFILTQNDFFYVKKKNLLFKFNNGFSCFKILKHDIYLFYFKN